MPPDPHFHQTLLHTVDLLQARDAQAFRAPSETLIGSGSVARIGESVARLNLSRVFVVVDQFLQQHGMADALFRALQRHGIDSETYTYAGGEPDTEKVENACRQLSRARCDAVIGLGGGSVLDTAKAIALLATHPDLSVSALTDASALRHARMPLLLVPTTAGTGSEATNVTVITDRQTKIKQVIAHAQLVPDVAVIDASLTLAVPGPLTAATGIDALTHAIEAYVARGASILSGTLALRAMALIVGALPIAVGNGANVRAREAMMLGSYLAGLAFSNAGLGLVHAMAHQIGARHHIPHGIANALLLPSVMQFNQLVCGDQYAEMARVLGMNDQGGTQLPTRIAQLIADIGLPANLKLAGVDSDDFDTLADNALADTCLPGNPRTASHAQIVDIYRHAWDRVPASQTR